MTERGRAREAFYLFISLQLALFTLLNIIRNVCFVLILILKPSTVFQDGCMLSY